MVEGNLKSNFTNGNFCITLILYGGFQMSLRLCGLLAFLLHHHPTHTPCLGILRLFPRGNQVSNPSNLGALPKDHRQQQHRMYFKNI